MDNDTLQPDATLEAPNTEAIEQEADGMPEGADEATAEVKEESPVEFDDRQQAKVNKLIGAKVKDAHDARRETDDLRNRLADAEARLPKETRPEIPQRPDAFDDDAQVKLDAREEAIKQAAAFDARQTVLQEQDKATLQQRQLAQDTIDRNETATYLDRAKEQKISEQDLGAAIGVIANYGISLEVENYIKTDDQGPLITTYLAQHPQELVDLQNLSTMQAAAHIASVIKPKATAARKTTNAPAPADIVNGTGSPPKQRGAPGYDFS